MNNATNANATYIATTSGGDRIKALLGDRSIPLEAQRSLAIRQYRLGYIDGWDTNRFRSPYAQVVSLASSGYRRGYSDGWDALRMAEEKQG